MSDNVITDLAIPAATGFAAQGLTETLVAGTRLGAEKTGDAIADALQRDSVKSLGFAAGITTALISYLLIHRGQNTAPNTAVADNNHQGKIEAGHQQSR